MSTAGAIVVPVRALLVALVAIAAVVAFVAVAALPGARDSVLRISDPRTTASGQGMDQQRTATERAVQRGYVKATAQLAEVRKLTLAIPSAQAEQIATKAANDVRQVRRDALAAVGARLGLGSPQLEQYVGVAEQQLGENTFADDRPVLLAPDLYAIVARADDLFQRTADAATRELTKAPATPAPTAAPTATSRPSATPSATPSASPTR